jgi:hypothetical protein
VADVFCIECRYLRIKPGHGNQERYSCSKARIFHAKSWLQSKPYREPPSDKNADNQCSDYKPKPSKGGN